MSDKLLTVAEVAQRLNVGRDAVRSYIRQGKLRGYRFGEGKGCAWRVDAASVEAFLEASMVVPARRYASPLKEG